MSARLSVEVVIAWPERAQVVELEVPAGTTVRQAVERSRLSEVVTDFDLLTAQFGIHAVKCAGDTLVADGDRVEIYRPLQFDPKARRRRKAQT